MRVHIIQQDEWVEPGEISAWIERHGYEASYTKCWKYEKVPETVDADFLVILGGWQSPQTTPEECDYYDAAAEKQLIQQYVDAGKLVLGVCLGAQLLGEALGAPYSHSPEREIGPVPVKLTEAGRKDPLFKDFPDTFLAGEWHNDMPGLTPESVIIAESEGCPRQIVRYQKGVYGFQTHMEFTHEIMEKGIEDAGEGLEKSRRPEDRFVQTIEELLAFDYAEMNALLSGFLDNLVKETGIISKRAPTGYFLS